MPTAEELEAIARKKRLSQRPKSNRARMLMCSALSDVLQASRKCMLEDDNDDEYGDLMRETNRNSNGRFIQYLIAVGT